MGFMNPLQFSGMSPGMGSIDGPMSGLFGQQQSMQLPGTVPNPNYMTQMPPHPQIGSAGGLSSLVPILAMLSGGGLGGGLSSILAPLFNGLGANQQFYLPQQGIPQSPSGPVTSQLPPIPQLPQPITTQPVARRPEPTSAAPQTPVQRPQRPQLPPNFAGGNVGMGGRNLLPLLGLRRAELM